MLVRWVHKCWAYPDEAWRIGFKITMGRDLAQHPPDGVPIYFYVQEKCGRLDQRGGHFCWDHFCMSAAEWPDSGAIAAFDPEST